MNWYHRLERRYVEYGSSLEATRAFGVFRALYDLVYNMNLAHLSPEVETVFESLDDAGERTACTPFLIYRGRHRHEVSLEGLLRRRSTRPNSSSTTTPGDPLISSTATSMPAAGCPAARPRSPATATATPPVAPPS